MAVKGSKHRVARKKRAGVVKKHDLLSGVLLMRYVMAYCEWLKVSGYSATTAHSRHNQLRQFVVWSHERGITDPREVTKPIIERYQRHLYYYRKEDGRGLDVGTQANLVTGLKMFFKWATRENHILYNPASEIDVPRPHKKLPQAILSVQEVEAILNAAEPVNMFALRDRALLELLYSTGLRRAEAANLTRYDVNINEGLVYVRGGKGGKDRVVPLGQRACMWLDKYLIEARSALGPMVAEPMFVTDVGEPMYAEFIAKRVRHYKALAGITKPGATHLLRHACATHMLEGGADIRFIQALLGHALLTTTEIYTHVSIEKLKAVHAAAHPARLSRVSSNQTNEGGAEIADGAQNAAQALLEALADEDEDGVTVLDPAKQA
jgi:integrase/recombinase XerD